AAVHDGARPGGAVGGTEGPGILDVQNTVVDDGTAAVGVGPAQNDFAQALLGQVVPGGVVADDPAQRQGAGAGAGTDGRVAVQNDVAGPDGAIVGRPADVQQRAGVADAGPVEEQLLADGGGNRVVAVIDLERAARLDRDRVVGHGGVAQSPGVGDRQNA